MALHFPARMPRSGYRATGLVKIRMYALLGLSCIQNKRLGMFFYKSVVMSCNVCYTIGELQL